MNLFNNINIDRFIYSLQYMWQGMISIFLVIGVLIAFVVVLNKLGGRKKKQEKQD